MVYMHFYIEIILVEQQPLHGRGILIYDRNSFLILKISKWREKGSARNELFPRIKKKLVPPYLKCDKDQIAPDSASTP